MSGRDFYGIVLSSSLISAALIFFLLRSSAPGPTHAGFQQPPSAGPAPLRTEDERINIDVYDSLSRSVVNVTSVTLEYTWFFDVIPREGVGSGVIIDRNGHIVTNYHVVRNAKRLEVTLYDKSQYAARVVGADPVNDLALLKIDCPEDKLKPAKLGRSDDLRVGQKVLAIGNPFGLERTLTTGIISSLERKLKTDFGIMDDLIQTDAAINPGNSGGPLLNTRAELIGINTAIYSRTGESAGIGFAVPVATLSRILPDLMEHGRVRRPWFGVQGQPLTPQLAEALKLPIQAGLLVEQVERGSSADRAGLRGGRRRVRYLGRPLIVGGDVIVSLAGEPVSSMDDLAIILEDKRPGEELSIVFYQDDRRVEKTVVLLGEGDSATFRF